MPFLESGTSSGPFQCLAPQCSIHCRSWVQLCPRGRGIEQDIMHQIKSPSKMLGTDFCLLPLKMKYMNSAGFKMETARPWLYPRERPTQLRISKKRRVRWSEGLKAGQNSVRSVHVSWSDVHCMK